MFLGHFGERVGFSGNFVLPARPDDIFEHNGYGPDVHSEDIHCTATQSLPKADADDIRVISILKILCGLSFETKMILAGMLLEVWSPSLGKVILFPSFQPCFTLMVKILSSLWVLFLLGSATYERFSSSWYSRCRSLQVRP